MKAIVNGKLVFPDRICKGTILIENGKIVASGDVHVPENADTIDARGLYVGPGLIDQHLHGYSCNGESISITQDVKAVATRHLLHGTTTITPSACYSQSKESFLSVIDQCNQAIADGNTTIAGIHFEGPYINPAQGSNSLRAWRYSEEDCEHIFRAANGNVLHCTYAPEIACAESIEAYLQKYNVVPAIGHTMADPTAIDRAVKKGAKIVTHLFDAMGNYREDAAKVTGDPQDCVSDIVLSFPDLYYELICDSKCVHVTAVSQRQTLKNAGEDHVILISDSGSRTSALDPSSYPPEDIKSANDLCFNQTGGLSGSRMTVAQCAANFKKVTGADIRVLFKCASTNAAQVLGLSERVGSIHAGKDANFVFVDEAFSVKQVIFRGEQILNIR